MLRNDLSKLPVISFLQIVKDFSRFVKNPVSVLNEYLKRAGDTFVLNLPVGNKPVVTANPHLIRHILQKKHRTYQRLPAQIDRWASFVGRGLLTSEGDYWLQQRRLIQPGFHREKLQVITRIMLEEVDQYLDQLDVETEEWKVVDMSQKMTELTFIIVAKSLLSTNLEPAVLEKMSHDLNELHHFVVRNIRQPFLGPWFKLTGKQKKYKLKAANVHKVILDIIHQRRQSKKQYNDLLDMLLKSRYEDTGEGMTDQQLLEECLILLIAGHETCANALAWAWDLLGRHPKVVKRIREEIDLTEQRDQLTFSALPNMVYLKSVIQEVMRLYPPVWGFYRVAAEDDNFEGLQMSKGRIIAIYIYGVHHSPQYYKNPESFEPSRFLGEVPEKRPAFAYLPFGGGPHLCIGNNFALIEMQLIIARIVQRYDLELVNDHPVGLMPLITLRPKDEIRVRLKQRRKVSLS